MIRRQSLKFQISPMKDVRGVAGTRSDGRKGWTDGRTHGRTRVISIVPLRLRRVTNKVQIEICFYQESQTFQHDSHLKQ